MPLSSAARTHARACSSSTWLPCVIQLPYEISLTSRPLRPRCRCFMRSTLCPVSGATRPGSAAASYSRRWSAQPARLKRAHGGVAGDAGRVLGAVLLLDLAACTPPQPYGVHDDGDEQDEHRQVGDGADDRVADEREQQHEQDDAEEHLADGEPAVDDLARHSLRRPGVTCRQVALVAGDQCLPLSRALLSDLLPAKGGGFLAVGRRGCAALLAGLVALGGGTALARGLALLRRRCLAHGSQHKDRRAYFTQSDIRVPSGCGIG